MTHQDSSSMARKARQTFPKQVLCMVEKEVSRAAVVARFMYVFCQGTVG